MGIGVAFAVRLCKANGMSETYTGKCLCGAVSYVLTGAPVVVAQCHCEACRRLSGTGHSAGAMFPARAVSVKGQLAEFSYTSDTGSVVTRASCVRCHSPIFGKNTHGPEHMTFTLGTLDDARALEVSVVIFDREKPHWDALPDNTEVFETQPDWTAEP